MKSVGINLTIFAVIWINSPGTNVMIKAFCCKEIFINGMEPYLYAVLLIGSVLVLRDVPSELFWYFFS